MQKPNNASRTRVILLPFTPNLKTILLQGDRPGLLDAIQVYITDGEDPVHVLTDKMRTALGPTVTTKRPPLLIKTCTGQKSEKTAGPYRHNIPTHYYAVRLTALTGIRPNSGEPMLHFRSVNAIRGDTAQIINLACQKLMSKLDEPEHE